MIKIKDQINKNNWTIRSLAVDENGQCVSYDSEAATKWCLVGWLHKVYTFKECGYIYNKIRAYLTSRNYSLIDISTWNDAARFEQVKQVVDDLDI